MIAGIKPDKQKELNEFITTMAPIMSMNDDDGLGYAAMTEEGIFTEHWLDPLTAFRERKFWSKKDQEVLDDFQGVFVGGPNYNFFSEKKGLFNKPKLAIIMHARMATVGEVAVKNVHPFYREGTALIHNGGISNHDAKHLKKITSTCDSEVILNSYFEREVAKDTANMQKLADDIRGGYACGVLTRDKDGNPILDLFRNGNSLSAIHVKELDAVVICTSAAMVREACKTLKWSAGCTITMKDDTFARMDARTGRFLGSVKFKSNSWTSSSSSSHYAHGGHGGYGDYDSEHWGGYDQSGTNAHSTSSRTHNVPDTNSNVATPDAPTVLGDADQQNLEMARAGLAEKKRPKLIEIEKLRRLGNTSSFQMAEFSKLKH